MITTGVLFSVRMLASQLEQLLAPERAVEWERLRGLAPGSKVGACYKREQAAGSAVCDQTPAKQTAWPAIPAAAGLVLVFGSH
jgi:hypothetical protein